MKKRLIAILLLSFILMSNLMVLAVGARASYQISSYNVTISDQGGGKVRVSAHVCGTHSTMTQIGMPTIVLYEKNNGTWKAVKTVTAQYDYNTGSHGYQFTYQGIVGCEYQAYSSFMATDAEGGDSRSCYSNQVVLK